MREVGRSCGLTNVVLDCRLDVRVSSSNSDTILLVNELSVYSIPFLIEKNDSRLAFVSLL